MSDKVFEKMLEYIKKNSEEFDVIVDADNYLGSNATSEDITNYLEFNNMPRLLNLDMLSNILITEGDILITIKIIHDLTFYNGEFILYINNDNIGTITYIVKLANKVYYELDLDLKIELDTSVNYNQYLNDTVSLIGSEDFIQNAMNDFASFNKIVV